MLLVKIIKNNNSLSLNVPWVTATKRPQARLVSLIETQIFVLQILLKVEVQI